MLDAGNLPPELAEELAHTGAIYLEDPQMFLSTAEWDAVESLCFHSGLPYETYHTGDTDEPNKCEVACFLTDVEGPFNIGGQVTDDLLKIIAAPAKMTVLERLLERERLYVRRAQANHMSKGSFIGLHRDLESNPDYEISIVLQLGRQFSGGEFVIHLPDNRKTVVKSAYRSITISSCEYPHEVLEVTQGTRTALVYFIAAHDGPNRRYLPAE